MISLFILLYILVFFLFKTSKVVECIRSRRNDLKSIYGSYMFLSDGLKMNSSFSQYYKVIFLIKDPIIAFTIVVLSHHPILQISLTFFTTFYLFIQEAHHKPQLNKIDHRISVMNSFLFTGVIGFYMAVYLQQDSIEVKQLNNFFGIPILLLFAMIIAINSLPVLVELKEKCIKLKNLKKGKSKVSNIKEQKQTDISSLDSLKQGSGKNSILEQRPSQRSTGTSSRILEIKVKRKYRVKNCKNGDRFSGRKLKKRRKKVKTSRKKRINKS